MKRLIAASLLLLSTALLGGCYYDPGYSYVRGGGSHGDAYYGRGSVRYDDGYYAPGYYGYAPSYYGGYGCCYPSGVAVGIGTTWYSGSHDRRGDYRYRDDLHRRDRDRDHGWYGRVQGDRGRGDNRPRATFQRASPSERPRAPQSTAQPRNRGDSGRRDERHRRDHERQR